MSEQKQGMRLAKAVADYVVFDLETTGMSFSQDDIIEISAVKVRGHEIVDTFSTLVNPERRIPSDATAINGITDDMVSKAPILREALKDFLDFVGNDVLVGHNIQSFDLKFIQQAADGLFGCSIANDFIDTLYMARRCLPNLSHHRLVDVAAHFHISTEGAHRALNDCIMNQKCYEELGKMEQHLLIVICPKCGGEMVRRMSKFGEFYGCSNYPNCKQTKRI